MLLAGQAGRAKFRSIMLLRLLSLDVMRGQEGIAEGGK